MEALARRPNGRWLRWLAGCDPVRYGVGRPLFFHHVPKTAGTSLIKAIGKMVLPELAFSEKGNLSAAFIDGLVERGLVPGQFIHGHPGEGAAAPLRGRAHIVTLLREPRDQVISNYLYVRFDRGVPDHGASRALGFREFVLARPRYAIFQTASLHLGIAQRPVGRAEDFIDVVPQILAYLNEMALVGTVDQASGFMFRLAEIMGWPRTPHFPHRRKARISSKQRERMQAQFTDLENHPMLSSLFAAERAVYLYARSIAEKNLGCRPPREHSEATRSARDSAQGLIVTDEVPVDERVPGPGQSRLRQQVYRPHPWFGLG
jgi:hypothetical protein